MCYSVFVSPTLSSSVFYDFTTLSVANAIYLMALKQSKSTAMIVRRRSKRIQMKCFCRLNAPPTPTLLPPAPTIEWVNTRKSIRHLNVFSTVRIHRLASSFTIIMQIRKGEKRNEKIVSKAHNKGGGEGGKPNNIAIWNCNCSMLSFEEQ